MQDDNDETNQYEPIEQPESGDDVTSDNIEAEPSDQPEQPEPADEPIESVPEPTVAAPAPVVAQAPVATPTTEPEKPKSLNNPGVIVLQWLVYAFWGWTVLAICIMTWAIISYFMDGTDVSDGALYGVAALLVLLPLSLACDIFYHKQEPEAKTGAASIIMIIHSVIFALFGIGALISAVLSGVNLLIGDSTTGVLNTLLTSLVVFGIYLLVFLRTLLPKRISIIRTIFLVVTTALIAIICVASFVGPVASKKLIQYDEKLNTALNSVVDSVSSYADRNKQLPDSLTELDITDDESAKVVNQGLISYQQKGESVLKSSQSFYYQLCVTYKRSTINSRTTSLNTVVAKANKAKAAAYQLSVDDEDYETYISTYSHPAGRHCYNMKVEEYLYTY